ncbi:MAG: aspartate--tRNA ligase, partial [Verrucomicrobia bacterium]|nr:aspartate--tRNA ligase [Verrucomicrobiota bacterium]
MYRTHHCNELRSSNVGQEVTLAGWIDSTRDHGGVIFVDLRDREGRTQIVFRPEEYPRVAASAHTLRNEDVTQITGKVARRVDGTQNPKLATGEIEVVASSLNILNRSEILPFPLDSEVG